MTQADRHNTILVLPLLEVSRTRSSAAISSSTTYLVQAIVQTSCSSDQLDATRPARSEPRGVEDAQGDVEDEDAASSFVYTAASLRDGSASMSEQDGGAAASVSIPWHISNRYYEADVRIEALRYENVACLLGSSGDAASRRCARIDQQQRAVGEDGGGGESGDVFDALSRPRPWRAGSSTAVMRASGEEEKRILVSKLDGVPAVVLLVDSSAAISMHTRILAGLAALPSGRHQEADEGDEEEEEEEEADGGLSGFNLEVSLVVGVPSARAPLDLDLDLAHDPTFTTSTSSSRDGATYEDLVELYATDGWEYVDLGCASGLDLDALDEDEDGISNDGCIGDEGQGREEEKQGIDRVREALMTYTWPGLVRNEERIRRKRPRGGSAALPPAILGGFSDWQQDDRFDADADADEDEDLRRALARLSATSTTTGKAPRDDDLAIPDLSLDLTEHATPNSTDEALARAFLARLDQQPFPSLDDDDATFPADTDTDTETETETTFSYPAVTNAKALKELEEFLQDQDPAWPSSSSSSFPPFPEDTTPNQLPDEATQGDAFDDDFDAFVSCPPSRSFPSFPPTTDVNQAHSTASEIPSTPFEDFDMDGKLEFQSHLRTLQMHAKRVRAITDHEQREKEAALVALAFSRQLGGEQGEMEL